MRPQLCHCCVLCVRAHLVVARDEVGEQLRYYARELLGSVAGQGHRSRAQAVGAGETGPRIAMPAKTWFCGGMANHKHSETRRHCPRTCRPSLKQISTRRRALVLCRFACPSGARQRAVPALIGARAFRRTARRRLSRPLALGLPTHLSSRWPPHRSPRSILPRCCSRGRATSGSSAADRSAASRAASPQSLPPCHPRSPHLLLQPSSSSCPPPPPLAPIQALPPPPSPPDSTRTPRPPYHTQRNNRPPAPIPTL